MSKLKIKTIVIIPAFNESCNIVSVIDAIKSKYPKFDILVVNDGSIDNTGKIAEGTGKANVINLPHNLGIGGAVQTGFIFARYFDYDIAIQFDGDGQHKVTEIDKLLEPILTHEADVVIGSRFCVKNKSWEPSLPRRFGIKTFEIINSLLTKQKITDNTSGFRAFNKRAICFLSNNYSMDYPEPESIIMLSKNKFIMKGVYVEMRARIHGKSSIRGIKSIYYMTKVILSVLIASLRPKIAERINY